MMYKKAPHPATVAQRQAPHPARLPVIQRQVARPAMVLQRMEIEIDPANDVIGWIKGLGKIEAMRKAFMTHGGWEGWLQVELALHLVATMGINVCVQREVSKVYGGSGEAADIVVNAGTGRPYVVELKCQGVNRKQAEFLALVKKDIVKVRKLAPTSYRAIAVAILMTDELVDYFRTNTGDIVGRNITRIGQDSSGDIMLFAWSNA